MNRSQISKFIVISVLFALSILAVNRSHATDHRPDAAPSALEAAQKVRLLKRAEYPARFYQVSRFAMPQTTAQALSPKEQQAQSIAQSHKEQFQRKSDAYDDACAQEKECIYIGLDTYHYLQRFENKTELTQQDLTDLTIVSGLLQRDITKPVTL